MRGNADPLRNMMESANCRRRQADSRGALSLLTIDEPNATSSFIEHDRDRSRKIIIIALFLFVSQVLSL